MADWSSTKPAVTDAPVYCESIRAYLSPGSFVIIERISDHEGEFQGKQQVGCIINSIDDFGNKRRSSPMLKINLFRILQDCEYDDLHIRKTQDLRIRDVQEIVQTFNCINLHPKAVVSLAFVFSLKELEDNEAIGCQGMDSLFLLRFRNQSEPVNPNWCLPFPSRYATFQRQLPDCYPSRIWNSLKVIRSEISRLLGRYSEKQGLFDSVRSKVTINKETWEYLLQKVQMVISTPRKTITSSVKRLLLPGLTLKSVRVQSHSTMIRFETQADLHILSSVLGQQIITEVRKRRPALNRPEMLHLNDAINIVVGASERKKEAFREHGCKEDGIDFIFDGKTDLKICIRYRRYQYAFSPTTGEPENCPPMLTQIIKRSRLENTTSTVDGTSQSEDEHASENLHIAAKAITITACSEFELDGKLFRVSSVDLQRQTVIAMCLYPVEIPRTQLTLGLNEARLLVANRLE